MALTASQVIQDVRNLIRGTAFAAEAEGIYINETHVSRERKEYIAIRFTTGTADQIETGVVTINYFIPDIDSGAQVLVEDAARASEIEALAQEWFDSIPPSVNYLFSLKSSIYTETDEDTNSHFVVIRLAYKYFGN